MVYLYQAIGQGGENVMGVKWKSTIELNLQNQFTEEWNNYIGVENIVEIFF